MTRYFTHYWRNESVDEYIRQYGNNAPCSVVYGGKRFLSISSGDYLYVITVRKGLLYLLGRLEVKIAGRRQDSSPYPGETEEDNQECEAEAVAPMFVRTDDIVSPELTQQIECIGHDGSKTQLTFITPGVLDQQTLRGIRELTKASASLLDQVMAEYEEDRVSDIDVQRSNDVVTAWQDEEGGVEGDQSTRLVNRYERDARLRATAIRIHGTRCQACGFSFEDVYGKHGAGYIEVHHLRPIYTYGGAVRVNPVSDMAVLCSNCHRMIHRNSSEPLSVAQLRALILTICEEGTA